MSNYVRAMNEDFGENTEVRNIDIDLSLNRSLEELESSYWEFVNETEGDDSANWPVSVQEDFSALEGYLMRQDRL